MAFKLELNTNATIELVCEKDSALKMDKEEYREYVDSGADSNLLKFSEGKSLQDCTRFVLRKLLPYKSTQKILDKQITTDVRGGAQTVNMSYILEEVRASLIDIINPEGLESPLLFKRGSDGLASEELVNALWHAGVAADLFRARNASTAEKESDNTELARKK